MPNLLIIEDDEDMAKLIQRHFERAGFSCVWKSSGEATLAWVQTDAVKAGPPLDAIVCDLGLPTMGGARVVELLRYEPVTSRAVIAVCSGRGSMQDHTLALEAGADLFLEKPVKMKNLEDELRRLLSVRDAP